MFKLPLTSSNPGCSNSSSSINTSANNIPNMVSNRAQVGIPPVAVVIPVIHNMEDMETIPAKAVTSKAIITAEEVAINSKVVISSNITSSKVVISKVVAKETTVEAMTMVVVDPISRLIPSNMATTVAPNKVVVGMIDTMVTAHKGGTLMGPLKMVKGTIALSSSNNNSSNNNIRALKVVMKEAMMVASRSMPTNRPMA